MALERFFVEKGLRQALREGEFVLHYQPQVAVSDGRMVGVEALIRWQHPERGFLLPGSFIAIANETELIDPISEWVLRTAFADLENWRSMGLPALRVAVNLSGRQVMHEPSIRRIITLVDEIAPRLDTLELDLEITETAMEFAERTMEVMGQLKEQGVMLAIGDFGTGHSLLSRLKELPVDTLKIVRSFVKDFAKDPDNRAIASAIVAMAHNLGLRVIGEGVETEQQFAVLRALDCEEIQGFYYSEPVPAGKIVHVMEQQNA